MIQKIILIVFLFFSFFLGNVFADSEAARRELENARKELDAWPPTPATQTRIADAEKALRDAERAERKAACAVSWDCIDMETFMIDTSLFSDGGKDIKVEWNSQATINRALGTIIQKLMIALWVISLLIMTIGAGYIILYRGEDEYLSKWKSIFIAGILALIVSLSSYYIINLISYILYR